MAEPYAPISIAPRSGNRTFPYINVGPGSNGLRFHGLGVAASIGSDSIWDLVWRMPNILPAGVPNLVLSGVANAVAGDAKINPAWNQAPAPNILSDLALVAEGVETISWGAPDNGKTKEVSIPLDHVTVAASNYLVMKLVFETSGWTLAQVSTWKPLIFFIE